MSSNKKYWKSVEELNDSSVVETLQQKEFAEEIPVEDFLGDKESLESSSTSRRDFLKYVGFSTAAATLAACEGPVIKSIPYVVQPDRVVPGIADYYATTIADGFDFASVLVKTREGRPIKIENNEMSTFKGGVNARVHASVLSLYDTKRVKRPMIEGRNVSWEEFNSEVSGKLNNVNGDVVILTQTFASPSTTKLIQEFSSKYGNARHIIYDTISEDAALNAFQTKYGRRALPNYDFSKAETIVSVGADFLGDWQGGGFDAGYARTRIPKNGKMSRHIQFEANMTLSGANADKRVPASPSQQLAILKAIAGNSSAQLDGKLGEAAQKAAAELRAAGSNGILVCGLPDEEAQTLALEVNERIGSQVMDTTNARMIRQGNSAEVTQLIEDMNNGSVGALLIAGLNPVYSLPNSKDFIEGMRKVETVVDFTMRADETSKLVKYVAATPHYLESWGDVQFSEQAFSVMQPTIRPLFDTRQFQDILLKWTDNDLSYYEYIKETWGESFGGKSWNEAVQDGAFKASSPAAPSVAQSSSTSGKVSMDLDGDGYELTLYSSIAIGDGQQANNPWLQEMPDPLTRASWDNYVTMSKADAEELDVMNNHVANGGLNGSYVNVQVGDRVVKNIPVIIQPGQARGSIGLALGYGRKAGVQAEMQTGVNAYPLYQDFKAVQKVKIEKAAGVHEFACVQLHNTLMGRGDIIKETTLEVFNTKDAHIWNHVAEVSLDHQEIPVTSPDVDIWESFDRTTGPHFNLSIDLNACTGCGACVIACHSENNVPVVGKTEVRRSRDMHWLRIDRYYSSEENFGEDIEEKDEASGLGIGNYIVGDREGEGSLSTFDRLETPADNPQVVFQPVMCQHCNHAPCETVCPVAATSHGRQGQNQMIYNRCVGTRYCANNCPYKVRRFNWFNYAQNEEFDYHLNNDLGRMVLNPDVTVRSRGVMEKCSMCIQKTQRTILDAKRDGRVIVDGEFHTACSSACDKGAMVFGDVNLEGAKILDLKNDDRMYHLLEYVGTKPNVMYQTKVRNTTEA